MSKLLHFQTLGEHPKLIGYYLTGKGVPKSVAFAVEDQIEKTPIALKRIK